jgi:hypothetical protein
MGNKDVLMGRARNKGNTEQIGHAHGHETRGKGHENKGMIDRYTKKECIFSEDTLFYKLPCFLA